MILNRGDILISSIFERYIDHPKFFIVLGTTPDEVFGFFFINSEIHPYIQKRKNLLDMQLIIKQEDYSSFLTHDSFIDATEVQEIPINELVTSFSYGITRKVGKLNHDDYISLLKACRESSLFSDIEKEDFFS